MKLLDANQAVARVAYLMSDSIPAYPITPATPMTDWATSWSDQNKTNLEGVIPSQTNWQSEGGVAGALHGSIQCGGLGTTFTASQGLLLMLPTMYRMAGSLLPNVIHVATRSIAKHSLSIFSDHTDIMAVRDSGYALLGSSTVQEAQDLACIAHMATLKGSIPFLHFFDGFKTSHATENIEELSVQQLQDLLPKKEIEEHRSRGLSPERPQITGTAQMGAEFFDTRKSHSGFYRKLPSTLEDCMNDFEETTGRKYRLFDYHGHQEATHVFVALASAAGPAREAVMKLNSQGHRVGVIVIRLFKPFSLDHFTEVLPITCSHLFTLEAGGDNTLKGGPIFQEVCTAINEAYHNHSLLELPVINAINYGLSGFPFTSGMLLSFFNDHYRINTPLFVNLDSLVPETLEIPDLVSEAIFVYDKTFDFDVSGFMDELLVNGYDFVQGNTYVTYQKNAPLQRMQVRWSNDPILQNHLIVKTHVLFAHWKSIPCLESEINQLKNNGTLFIVGPNEGKERYSKELQELYLTLALKNCEVIYISLPESSSKTLWSGVFQQLDQYDVSNTVFNSKEKVNEAKFDIPSALYYIPDWDSSACTQCGLCSLVCPSGALEAKAFDSSFGVIAPSGFPILPAKDTLGLQGEGSFTIQINTEQCDECLNCVTSCPEKAIGKSQLTLEESAKHWKFFSKIPNMEFNGLDKTRLPQLQLFPTYYQDPMSDKGSAVSVYLKLLSKLFGDSLVIANATGSSSIIAGAEGYSPWMKNKEGKGPVWSNSLFENNAEYGLGMRLQYDLERKRVKNWLKAHKPNWLRRWEESEMDTKPVEDQRLLISEWKSILASQSKIFPSPNLDALSKKSMWLVGGDGWAYDIGFGGLDHVLASGANVNILVLDNELYENTGGQYSKASPLGANRMNPKKDIGRMAMTYDHVYVASVAYGANPEQLVKVLQEAESYNGPSLILAYCHSKSHGIDMREPQRYHKAVVESGNWLLYRRDPRLENPLQLDAPKPSLPLVDYLIMEERFQKVVNPDSKNYDPKTIAELQQRIDKRYALFKNEAKKMEWEEVEALPL